MNRNFGQVGIRSRLSAVLLALASCLVPVSAMGFDIERFLALDRSEIRTAERQLDRLLDAYEQDPAAQSLSEAERYVVERELYWQAAAQQPPQAVTREDGSTLIKLNPAALNATVLSADEHGLPILGCVVPRHGRQRWEPVELSPHEPSVAR